MYRLDYSLYLVTDRSIITPLSLEDCVNQALAGGVTLVQLREKEVDDNQYEVLAKKIKNICDVYHVPLIINDRISVALNVDAYGVHLGQQDLSAAVARKVLGPNRLLGVSVTNVDEAVQAQTDGADYLGVGAMFRTKTKGDAALVSLDTLEEIRRVVKLPIVTIGGMNRRTIPVCASYGVQGFAVVSALVCQSDIFLAAQQLKQYAMRNVTI